MHLVQAVLIHLVARCHDCRHEHTIRADAATWLARMDEWRVKHQGHRFDFITPKRQIRKGLLDRYVYPVLDRWGVLPWWLDREVAYTENTDHKLAYTADAAYTITLASLASSSTHLVGQNSTAVSNTTDKMLEITVEGEITVGSSPTPTAGTSIRVRAYGSNLDTPDYPDGITATDAGKTITNAQILKLIPEAWSMEVAATDNVPHPVFCRALSLAFGGVIPKNHGLFVSHNTGTNLHATPGNHWLRHTGVYLAST